MRLRRALDEFVVDGVETTLPLFRELVRNSDVQNGQYDIHWLENFLRSTSTRKGEKPGSNSVARSAEIVIATLVPRGSRTTRFDLRVCNRRQTLSRYERRAVSSIAARLRALRRCWD